MKKILFLLAMLPMMVFTACSSSDDGFTPTGTYTARIKNYFGDDEVTYNVRFINSAEYEFTYKSEDYIWDKRVSTYTLNYPKIHFKDFGPDSVVEDKDGEFIDENTIRIGGNEYIRK